MQADRQVKQTGSQPHGQVKRAVGQASGAGRWGSRAGEQLTPYALAGLLHRHCIHKQQQQQQHLVLLVGLGVQT